MAGKPSDIPSLSESINRSLNLLVAAVLGVTALAFGSDLLVEADPVDKIDNTLLVVVGVVAVAWYFIGRNWGKRTVTPVILAGAALAAQIAGVGVEAGDSVAIGDDIPGMIVFVTTLIIVIVVYSMNGKYLAAGAPTNPAG